MWVRVLMMPLMLAAGCIAANNAPDEPIATIIDSTTVHFHCLNHESIHVVTCSGSISLFPITITVNSLRILSDNEIDILDGDLDELSVLDGDELDHDKMLHDVKTLVLHDFVNQFSIAVSDAETVVCTTVSGSQVCI